MKALTWNYTSPLGHGDYLSFYYTPRRINFDFGGRNIINRLNVFSSRSKEAGSQRFEDAEKIIIRKID